VSETAIDSMKLELDATTSALAQKNGNVKNLEETVRALRSEIGDLKNLLAQADDLATSTQSELAAVNSALQDELANGERLARRLVDESAKSQKLEQTTVDLYAELESRDAEFEREAKNRRLLRQEVETKLRVSEEDNANLNDLLRNAEKRIKQLEESLNTREKRRIEPKSESVTSEGTKQDMIVDKFDSRPDKVAKHPILGADISSDGVVQPNDSDNLTERYAVAVKRMQSLQRDLRHSEARQAEVEDSNALLRQQVADIKCQQEETAGRLTAKVEQLTAQLNAAEERLQQLKVGCL